MKSKQVLDVQQMQHLQELGMDTNNASASWYKPDMDTEYMLMFGHMKKEELVGNEESIPAYTLQDVLDALPVEILKEKKRCWLSVDLADKTIEYYNEYAMYMRRSVYFEFYKSSSLIDAAYSMLCWAIEQGYVETDKNE